MLTNSFMACVSPRLLLIGGEATSTDYFVRPYVPYVHLLILIIFLPEDLNLLGTKGISGNDLLQGGFRQTSENNHKM